MDELESATDGESSAVVRGRVATARGAQCHRFASGGVGTTNAGVSIRELRESGAFTGGALTALRSAAGRLALSARAYHRALRVARTVADLDGEPEVSRRHALEALAYRGDLPAGESG